MKASELARKKNDFTISLNSMCDMRHCTLPVQVVMILEGEEWQLCMACYDSYIEAVLELQKRDAAEHCVEPSQSGPTVTEKNASEKSGAVAEPPSLLCMNCGHPRHIVDEIMEKCQHCGDDELDFSQDIVVP